MEQYKKKEFDENGTNNNLIDRIFITKFDANVCFTYVDQIYYSISGYISQELIGVSLYDCVHEDDRDKLRDVLNRVCQDFRKTTSDIYRFRTKDNMYIDLETIFEPFINPWNDELEIIVARNMIKWNTIRTSTTNDDSSKSPKVLDQTELIRQLLP